MAVRGADPRVEGIEAGSGADGSPARKAIHARVEVWCSSNGRSHIVAGAANANVDTAAHFSGPNAAQPKGSNTSTAPTMRAAAISRTADHLEGAADLTDMETVVAGDHSKAQIEALRSPLGVDPEPGSLFGSAPSPQRHVGFAESLE